MYKAFVSPSQPERQERKIEEVDLPLSYVLLNAQETLVF